MQATVKLSKAEIEQLVQEREQELAVEMEKLRFEKSLQNLAKRMEKKGFYIGKKLFAHIEHEEKNRWVVNRYRCN
jgi:hypothetical protein